MLLVALVTVDVDTYAESSLFASLDASVPLLFSPLSSDTELVGAVTNTGEAAVAASPVLEEADNVFDEADRENENVEDPSSC